MDRETIDDLLFLAQGAPIDGPGRILGGLAQASPSDDAASLAPTEIGRSMGYCYWRESTAWRQYDHVLVALGETAPTRACASLAEAYKPEGTRVARPELSCSRKLARHVQFKRKQET